MKRKVLLIVCLTFGLISLAGYFVLPHEPTYSGKSLGAWLRDFESEQMEDRAKAGEAIRGIGATAVPYLTKRLKYVYPGTEPETSFEKWRRRALERFDEQFGTKWSAVRPPSPRHQAMAALDALGPAATNALPALEVLLREDPPDPSALFVIARLGLVALPVITKALTNEVKVLRLEARVCLDMINTHSPILYPEIGWSDPHESSFARRTCAFNLKVVQASFQEYRAEHPEAGLPATVDGLPPARVPQGFQLPTVRTNTSK